MAFKIIYTEQALDVDLLAEFPHIGCAVRRRTGMRKILHNPSAAWRPARAALCLSRGCPLSFPDSALERTDDSSVALTRLDRLNVLASAPMTCAFYAKMD